MNVDLNKLSCFYFKLLTDLKEMNLLVLLTKVPFGQISHLKQHGWIPSILFAYPSLQSLEHWEIGTCA